jgi:hypothetical protein
MRSISPGACARARRSILSTSLRHYRPAKGRARRGRANEPQSISELLFSLLVETIIVRGSRRALVQRVRGRFGL